MEGGEGEWRDVACMGHMWIYGERAGAPTVCSHLPNSGRAGVNVVLTVLYNSSSRGMVRKLWIFTPFSISSFTKSTRSNTSASIMACSSECTYSEITGSQCPHGQAADTHTHTHHTGTDRTGVVLTQFSSSSLRGSVSTFTSSLLFFFPLPLFTRCLTNFVDCRVMGSEVLVPGCNREQERRSQSLRTRTCVDGVARAGTRGCMSE